VALHVEGTGVVVGEYGERSEKLGKGRRAMEGEADGSSEAGVEGCIVRVRCSVAEGVKRCLATSKML